MIKRLFIHFPIVLMLLLPFSEAWAQQQTVSLSLSNFDKNDYIRLTDSPDWEFKLGSNTDWETANKESNGWEPLSPGQLSLNQADATGKLEGWFRIKLRTDSLIASKPLFIYFRNPGSAVDMYVDGKLIKSFGNTGNIGGTYVRVNAKKTDFFLPFDCKADSTYLFSF